MPDFTSALYLGLAHGSGELAPWNALTTGKPAALAAPPEAQALASRLAALLGTESATLAPSTLHAFFDVFAYLGRQGAEFHLDAGCYPIARWALRGAGSREFTHHDPLAFHWRLRRARRLARRPPVVVTDGFCLQCGNTAPLADHVRHLEQTGGWLVVDDTQALGVLGERPDAERPLGRGGGGTLRWMGAGGTRTVVVASLAKAFGVPLAVIGGNVAMIRALQLSGPTRRHCSPPSLAVLSAARHALDVNDSVGEQLRARLTDLVRRFRAHLASTGLALPSPIFPAHTIRLASPGDAACLRNILEAHAIRSLWQRAGASAVVHATFLLRADHPEPAIDLLGSLLARTVRPAFRPTRRRVAA